MGYSWQQGSASLPITLGLDEVERTVPCPTCERLEYEGTITLRVSAERPAGTTPARCSRGHTVLVNWTREDEAR